MLGSLTTQLDQKDPIIASSIHSQIASYDPADLKTRNVVAAPASPAARLLRSI